MYVHEPAAECTSKALVTRSEALVSTSFIG